VSDGSEAVARKWLAESEIRRKPGAGQRTGSGQWACDKVGRQVQNSEKAKVCSVW